jgi:hypothetical protein
LADIFHEVDEEVRREQLKKLWERYGHYAVALAVIIVIAVGGWRGYEYWQGQKIAEAGAAFEAAMALADEGKQQEAEQAFARLAQDGTSGYRVLARLRTANALAGHDVKAAVAAYDGIAADTGIDHRLRDLAGLRAALLLADTASFDDMQRRLEPLTGPKDTFRHATRELLALSAWRAGNSAQARRWADMVVSDPESPASLRQRMQMLLALLPPAAKG